MCQGVVIIFFTFPIFHCKKPIRFCIVFSSKKFQLWIIYIVNYSNINTGQLIFIFLTLRPLKKNLKMPFSGHDKRQHNNVETQPLPLWAFPLIIDIHINTHKQFLSLKKILCCV